MFPFGVVEPLLVLPQAATISSSATAAASCAERNLQFIEALSLSPIGDPDGYAVQPRACLDSSTWRRIQAVLNVVALLATGVRSSLMPRGTSSRSSAESPSSVASASSPTSTAPAKTSV